LWLPTLAVSLGLLAGGPNLSAAEKAETKAGVYNFGALHSLTADAARAQAQAWLKAVGHADPATDRQFEAIWTGQDRPVVDRIADTLSLGDQEAARLLAEARNPQAAAPKAVPALLTDAGRSGFYRANLALAYAKALSGRRVYEEALDTLKGVKPEEVAEPAAYFFHKAVAEHALIRKEAAAQSILRLLDDVSDTPERYRQVAGLMFADMQGWKKEEKDLENIARLMDNIERRLNLSRGGQKTQDIQKKVVFRLDELIKEMENQAKNCSQCNGGNCPGGGQQKPNGGKGPNPQLDSFGGRDSGLGLVDKTKLQELAGKWGTLPDAKRAEAMMEITRDLPPRYREVIENYLKSLSTEP
jgi:primosomal protein N''